MDYAIFGGNPPQPTELSRLRAAAERLSVLVPQVTGFINRFNGSPQVASALGRDDADLAAGYQNDLNALFSQIDALERAVEKLSTIG